MSNPNAKRITDLLSADNIDPQDLFEIVDRNGDQNGNPQSESATFKLLYNWLIQYEGENIQNIINEVESPSRYVRVNNDFPDNEGPYFNSLELAVDYSRGIVNTLGGRVIIQVFFDSNGNPLDPNLDNYTWYTSDPVDSDIEVISESPKFSSSGFVSELISGGNINLNELEKDYNLNEFRTDIEL